MGRGWTTLAVAALAQQVKGASARCAGARGIVVRWQRGYGAFSVSPDGVPALEAYLREQAAHHRLGGVIARWECALGLGAREGGRRNDSVGFQPVVVSPCALSPCALSLFDDVIHLRLR